MVFADTNSETIRKSTFKRKLIIALVPVLATGLLYAGQWFIRMVLDDNATLIRHEEALQGLDKNYITVQDIDKLEDHVQRQWKLIQVLTRENRELAEKLGTVRELQGRVLLPLALAGSSDLSASEIRTLLSEAMEKRAAGGVQEKELDDFVDRQMSIQRKAPDIRQFKTVRPPVQKK